MILMGYCRGKEKFDWNFFLELDEIKGYWWELCGNLMGNPAPTPSKREETALGGMFAPPNWLIPSKNKKPWCSLHALF
jgi:hypothetical protein